MEAMVKPELTKEIAYKSLQDFFNQVPFVLFATGASCAVDFEFSMGALEQYLRNEIPKLPLTGAQKTEWDSLIQVLSLNPDFEAAMNSIKDGNLLKKVIDKTAEHISNIDQKHAFEILKGKENWPAIGMFERLVERLPENSRMLHVATPNYDLLAEYAFARAEIPYTTGFWGGVLRKLDWAQAERQMTYADEVISGKKKQLTTRYKKHIRLYKVHGSLNTFIFNNQIVETDIWLKVPDTVDRLMITPGTSKHQKLHDYRDALLGEFDRAIKQHCSFLFLGFGFNDTQLVNNTIYEKLKNQNSSALIITRSINGRIEKLLEESKNAWLVCKNDSDESTRIFNSQYNNWLRLTDKEIWQFDKFSTEIMGG